MDDIRVGILTVSDRASKGEYNDASGPLLNSMVIDRMHGAVVLSAIVPDDFDTIKKTLLDWADSGQMNLVLTTGGTGFAPRDVTPEATLQVIDRETPGLAEVMRLSSLKVTPHAMLSRAVAGIRGKTLIINLPGSPKAARENLEALLPALAHGLELLAGSRSDAAHQFKPKAPSV